MERLLLRQRWLVYVLIWATVRFEILFIWPYIIVDRASMKQFRNLLATSKKKQFIRLDMQENYYKLLIFLDGLLPHLQFEVRKTGPTLYESAKELARNIEAALNEQSLETTSAISAFQQNCNTAT